MTVFTEHEGFPAIPLRDGMTLQLEAIDPTTGADVSGVEATRFMVYGIDESDVFLEDVVPVYSLDNDEDEGLGLPHA